MSTHSSSGSASPRTTSRASWPPSAYPTSYWARTGSKVSGRLALLLVLRYWACPTRWMDLTAVFGLSESAMSDVYLTLVCDLYALLAPPH